MVHRPPALAGRGRAGRSQRDTRLRAPWSVIWSSVPRETKLASVTEVFLHKRVRLGLIKKKSQQNMD